MPERELDLEQSEKKKGKHKPEDTGMVAQREADEKEAQSIQQVDVSAQKHVKSENPLFGWTATDQPLEIPRDSLSHVPSTGTSINIFVRGVGVGLTHTKNLMIKKPREVRETNGLELDQEGAELTIGRRCLKFRMSFRITS